MINLFKYLHTKDEKYQDLIITSVEYLTKENLLKLKLQYTCDVFSDEYKIKFENDLKEFFDNSFDVECKFKKYFIDEEFGEWYGYLHYDNTPSTTLKGNIFKGPFHIPRMYIIMALLEETGSMAAFLN